MTLHSEIEQSDDNKGAYTTDEPITFNQLTKSTTKNHSEQSASAIDLSVDDPGGSDTETDADDGVDNGSEQRKRLADAVIHQHVESGPDQTLASTRVDGVAGQSTSFHFCTVDISGTTCYYLLQRTITGDRFADVTTAIKDVGTSWDYRVPTIDAEKMNERIQEARHRDLRRGDDPVEFLTGAQIDAVQREYAQLVESEIAGLEDGVGVCRPDAYLFAQFTVFDVSEVVFRIRMQEHLSARQLDVVQDSLLAAVWEDLGSQQCDEYGVTGASMECPIAVELDFDF